MAFHALEIDQLIADALTNRPAGRWTGYFPVTKPEKIIERIEYHGIAGLLASRPDRMDHWPTEVIKSVRQQAVAMAMWELNHHQTLNVLLSELAAAGILPILLKGTAIAYAFYETPSTRARGDTDLLIDSVNVVKARLVFERLGYQRESECASLAPNEALQEVWSIGRNGAQQHVDLHWQLLNAPALRNVLPFSECASDLIPLVRLSPDAYSMDVVRTLIHTCIHRSMHFTSPYFVNDQVYYGGDRLIWLQDIHRLATALSETEWFTLCSLCDAKGVSTACLDGLETAHRSFATSVPSWVFTKLSAASDWSTTGAYLRSRQFGRAWRDWHAVPGFKRKIAYFLARLFPPAAFLRGKYPRMAQLPLFLLNARRLIDLIRPRPGSGQ